MLKLNIAAIKEGQSVDRTDVEPFDVGLAENKEFNGTIHITHRLNKVGHEVFIKTLIQTTLDLECDVCLEPYALDVEEKVSILLTGDPDLVEREEDDVYLVSESAAEVDITESIRQSLLLTIPFKKVCKSDCLGLCPECGANLNDGPCACKRNHNDPRWEALKNIKFD